MTDYGNDLDRELWEPGASGVPLPTERDLLPLRFDPQRHPLDLERLRRARSTRPRMHRRIAALVAIAAVLVLAVQGVLRWRLAWPDGRAWPVTSHSSGTTLPPGDTLRTTPGESALVRIARIGWMRVGSNSEVRLRATGSRRHRLALDRGELHVSVWAPPFSVFVATPAGDVIDLGCEFTVRSSASTTVVDVESGWVLLENDRGEALIPAGARGTMSSQAQPGVPVYLDASPAFHAAVAEMDRDSSRAVERLLAGARPADVLTLLQLATRHPAHRTALLLHAHRLDPELTEDELRFALDGSDRAVWQWVDRLPLPSPKSWLHNWRDAFPPTKRSLTSSETPGTAAL